MKINKLIEYPLTRPFGWGRWFHLSAVLLALISLSIFTCWGAATAGYDTVSILSSNYTLVDNDHWYYRFTPESLRRFQSDRPLCDPVSIDVASPFLTNQSIFTWTLGSYANSTSLQKAVRYEGQALDACDITSMTLTIDVAKQRIDTRAMLSCINGPWPAIAGTIWSWSFNPFEADSPFQDITHDPGLVGPAKSVQLALNYFATLAYSRSRQLFVVDNGTYPQVMSLLLVPYTICPQANNNGQGCPDTDNHPEKPLFRLSAGYLLYHNGDVSFQTPTLNDYLNTPISNFITAFYSALRYDIGSTRQNNILTSQTALSSMISFFDPLLPQGGILPASSANLGNSSQLTTIASLPLVSVRQATVQAVFLCRIKQAKSVAGAIFAVGGLALSLFTSFWALFIFLAATLYKKRDTSANFCLDPAGHGQFSNPSSVAGIAYTAVRSNSNYSTAKQATIP